MGDPSGWMPCQHDWDEVIYWGDPNTYEMCTLCGVERDKEVLEARKGGWNPIGVEVSGDEGLVKLTIFDEDNPLKVLYKAKFTPAIARELAFRLTWHALKIEDDT